MHSSCTPHLNIWEFPRKKENIWEFLGPPLFTKNEFSFYALNIRAVTFRIES